MNSMEPTKCALWARVSTTDQHTENQIHELREWAERRGLEITREFIIEDSAWANGNGAKGKIFDTARGELLDGARMGHYTVVLVWALDRLSRRGGVDALTYLGRLADAGCVLWSRRESWTEDLKDPRMRELFTFIATWMSESESGRRSERIKAGMARRRRDIDAGKIEGKVGGRKAGSKDKRKRSREGYEAAWEPGATLYEAREQRLAARKAELLADPVRLRDLRRDVPCGECGAGIGDPCRRLKGKHKGVVLGVRDVHTSRRDASGQALQVSAIVSEAAEPAAQHHQDAG